MKFYLVLSHCGLSVLCMVSSITMLPCWYSIFSLLGLLLSYSLTSYPQFWPVKLNANRVVIGTLRGFDQFMNLVVDNTVEVNGNDKNDIGMVVSYFIFGSIKCSVKFFKWYDIKIIVSNSSNGMVYYWKVTSSAGYQGEQCCHDRSPRTGCQSSVNCQPALVVNKLVVLI